MKAVFLCENAARMQEVYHPGVLSRLQGMTDLDLARYSKADVLANPERFADVEIVFSTWGMPSFTEQEIRACLPCHQQRVLRHQIGRASCRERV